MKLKTVVFALLISFLTLPLQACSGSYASFSDTRLGYFDTVCTITGYADSRGDFEKSADALFSLIDECNKLFDIYNDHEGINNIKTINDNAGRQAVKVDAKIIGLLSFSLEMYGETDGALNIMIGALTRVWHKYRTENDNRLPSSEELESAAMHISPDSLVIDAEASTVYISDPEASLDVGAVAKGYAARLILDALPDTSLLSAVIDLGGNIVTYGTKPDGSPWKVAVGKGTSGEYLKVFELTGLSVVTSGDYQRFYEVDGVRYHHIIDPSTGYPAGKCSQVSVVCADPALADAMSTALFVSGAGNFEELAEKYGLYIIAITDDKTVEAGRLGQ